MKRIVFVALAVVAVFLAYRTWPILSAAQLGSAIQRGDLQEVIERIDFVALRRSLGRQVARAYLDESARGKELGSFGRSAAIGAGTRMAEAYLEEVLTPQNVAALLREGRLPNVKGAGRPVGIDRRLPDFSETMGSELLRTFLSSGFKSPTRFAIQAGDANAADASYGLVFALQGFGWRLAELELPPTAVQQLARELMAREKSQGAQ
jgi:hypothetical protein